MRKEKQLSIQHLGNQTVVACNDDVLKEAAGRLSRPRINTRPNKRLR